MPPTMILTGVCAAPGAAESAAATGMARRAASSLRMGCYPVLVPEIALALRFRRWQAGVGAMRPLPFHPVNARFPAFVQMTKAGGGAPDSNPSAAAAQLPDRPF